MAVRPAEIAVARLPRVRPGAWPVLARFARKKPLGAAGGVLMLVMVLTAVFPDFLQSHDVIAISIPIIPRAARVIRSSVLSIREMQYVEAARSLGVRHLRIAFRHVLPNTVGPFIVLCTAQLGSAILVEATLSFLGLGVPEP